jgi:AraC-like DNA-binding protein
MPHSSVVKCSDPHEIQQALERSDFQMVATARGSFESKLAQITMNRLMVKRGTVSLPTVTYSATSKDHSVIFLHCDPHQAPIKHSGTDVAPDEIVWYPVGSDHHYRTFTNYNIGNVVIPYADLAGYGEMFAERKLTAPQSIRVLRPLPSLMSRLRNLHQVVSHLAANTPDILVHPEVVRTLEQALVRATIGCLIDPDTQDRGESARRRLPVMRRFEQMLEQHSDSPLHVMDICAGIGVTDRTLRLHCQEQLGMGPHLYLWLRRMNLARRALASADPTANTVTSIANDYGFAELGRFAVSYRNLFGESPSVTLRRRPGSSRILDKPAEQFRGLHRAR